MYTALPKVTFPFWSASLLSCSVGLLCLGCVCCCCSRGHSAAEIQGRLLIPLTISPSLLSGFLPMFACDLRFNIGDTALQHDPCRRHSSFCHVTVLCCQLYKSGSGMNLALDENALETVCDLSVVFTLGDFIYLFFWQIWFKNLYGLKRYSCWHHSASCRKMHRHIQTTSSIRAQWKAERWRSLLENTPPAYSTVRGNFWKYTKEKSKQMSFYLI